MKYCNRRPEKMFHPSLNGPYLHNPFIFFTYLNEIANRNIHVYFLNCEEMSVTVKIKISVECRYQGYL